MISAATMTVDMVVLAVMVKIGSHTSGIIAAICIFLYESLYTWGWVSLFAISDPVKLTFVG